MLSEILDATLLYDRCKTNPIVFSYNPPNCTLAEFDVIDDRRVSFTANWDFSQRCSDIVNKSVKTCDERVNSKAAG